MIVAGLKIHSHRALAPNSKKRIVSINPELRILTLRNQRFLLRCKFFNFSGRHGCFKKQYTDSSNSQTVLFNSPQESDTVSDDLFKRLGFAC
jgi:hypothetical protein